MAWIALDFGSFGKALGILLGINSRDAQLGGIVGAEAIKVGISIITLKGAHGLDKDTKVFCSKYGKDNLRESVLLEISSLFLLLYFLYHLLKQVFFFLPPLL